MTRHEAELLGKKKVTRKLFEELFTAPPPSSRPAAVRLKPSRCVAWYGVALPAHQLPLTGSWLAVGCGVRVASPLPPAETDPGLSGRTEMTGFEFHTRTWATACEEKG